MNSKVNSMVINAAIAALYVVLTLVTFPISYSGIQFRIAELLVLLCFFRKDYAFGLTIGCVIANLASSIGFIDCLFGGLATLISCLLIGYCKYLIVAVLIPIVINGFAVGFELYLFMEADLLTSILWVALGELAVMIVSYILLRIFSKRDWFYPMINANQNINWKF